MAGEMMSYGDEYDMREEFGDGMESDFNILGRVKKYITDFYQKFCENDVAGMRAAYFKEWTQLTGDYYKDSEWPISEEISSLCNFDELFLLCYNELRYRHISIHQEPMIHHRIEAWNNYRELFDTFLQGSESGSRCLPVEWLSDMIDEFLYQFQDFCRYKHDVKSLSPEEIALLKENPNVWKTETVFGYLTLFVQVSGILGILEKGRKVSNFGKLNLLQSMGYFCILGLCRLHTLLGDYRLAVKVLDPIDIDDRRALYTGVTSCHITLFYYLGFAYMMMKRYQDAIGVFSSILLAHRGSKEMCHSYGDSQIFSKLDKTRALTAMSMALSPGTRVDMQVKDSIEDRFSSDRQSTNNLSNYDPDTYASLFFHACPKFIVPSTPNYSSGVDGSQQTVLIQKKWFLQEVMKQQAHAKIRSYLKLYTSIPIEKLARFCNMQRDVFERHLLSLKYSAYQNVHIEGAPPLESRRAAVNGILFCVVGDMVFVDETKPSQRYSHYFLTHAHKLQQAVDDISELKKKR